MKLRVGLLIDDYLKPTWVYNMLELITKSHHSELVLVIRKSPTVTKKKPLWYRLWSNRKHFIFNIYNRLDSIIFKSSNDAFALKDIRELFELPEVLVKPKLTRFSDTILEEDIKIISDYNVDVLIRLGFRILRGSILNVPKYGVWSFHHGDHKVNRGGPAGVWEVFNNWPETGVVLQILTEDLDGGLIIDKSISSTDPISITRNRNNYYWKALSMVPRRLNQLYTLGGEEFMSLHSSRTLPMMYYNPLFTTPENMVALKGIFIVFIRYVLSRVRRIFYKKQWILLYQLGEYDSYMNSLWRFKKIIPPKDRFWADPFTLYRNGRYYIFIEELINNENKGKIALIEMDEGGIYSMPKTVLEKDYHLSYPFIIEDQGEFYMVPETSQNNTIELYKAIKFPDKWEFVCYIMEGVKAVDSTIIKYNNRYWLFCNMIENPGASSVDELFIFMADSLHSSEWIPHKGNPVVSDASRARPAGRIFEFNGYLYRPSQDCSIHYGYGININRIIELGEEVYLEERVQTIHPNWDRKIKSTHTLTHDKNLTVVDAIYTRFFL